MMVTISSYYKAHISFKIYIVVFGTLTFEWFDSNQRLYKVDHPDGNFIKDGFRSIEAAEEWCRQMEYTICKDEGEAV